MHYSLLPSLPAQNWEQLAGVLNALAGVAIEFQVDLVDGVFVPHTSWPFTESDVRRALKQLSDYTSTFEIECDCMVHEPLQYFDDIISLGVKRLIVHYGNGNRWEDIVAHQKRHGYQLGLAITNDVPLSDVTAVLPDCNFIQVMGIAQVGAQGQSFDERTLETVTTLRASHPELEIAIDGAVNETTIPQLKRAGANRFAPGSAIIMRADPAAAYKHLFEIMQAA